MAPRTAVLDRPTAPPAVSLTLLPVEAVGKSTCDVCSHGRKQHSRAGCIHRDGPGQPQCTCPMTYMDL